ncbi:hypothetical protein H4R33_005462 [Dimargaris cristalligena]|uniref:Inhibitor of apoptosis-promoting Bax1-domain-containing protein n=1 Tax=Dimargaris cristalligena TaxID=215637 RepID=A0A4P9ZNF4_9FUNG|nr:hypothetical protein H4R33_005462 [Dimargaris cristalligena]RKP34944.1 inhibitor of apoptosis-promoting Bax1-domain-containing protein [Dimargaris cristalligena]|eukprot:RKP34944.1 inhibitor of apoptosis-promoting Bax1-domain-containing protein [Dimargaris cristalligena]
MGVPASAQPPSVERPLYPTSQPPPAYDQPGPSTYQTIPDLSDDDLPDDFKYGTTVSQCDREVRFAFLRKVYSILTAQLLTTVAVTMLFFFQPSLNAWAFRNVWSLYVAAIGAMGALVGLYCQRRSVPANFAWLALFTSLEAYTVGFVVCLYDVRLVIQALLLTLGLFTVLTLFTFQSRFDFSRLGPILFFGLVAVLLVGLVQIFLPFNRTFDLIMAILTAVIFSGYIMYDTHLIIHRLSPEEYMVAAVDLYLDIINLFLAILRILANSNSD